jgi:hypothetical protein
MVVTKITGSTGGSEVGWTAYPVSLSPAGIGNQSQTLYRLSAWTNTEAIAGILPDTVRVSLAVCVLAVSIMRWQTRKFC